jgi:excisionase family DNA binding protein
VKRVTVAEAAAILGVSVDVVRKRLQRGTLAGEKQGRTWLVTLQQDNRQDTDRTPTGHRQDAQKPCNRHTVDATGQPTGHRQDTDRTRQDMFDDLLDCDPSIRAAVLEANLRGAQALLRHTETELAATREEVVFLREQLAQKDVVISRLSEAQVEALRRRDILDAQERNALPKPVASRAWWRFWR